ncbi:MAG: hypothetical protein ACRECR_01245, partial [Thermoplasmata archaeon]
FEYSANSPGWQPFPASGTVTVRAIGPSPIAVVFHRVNYQVSFAEEGLPAGTNWNITLNGVTNSSAMGSIGFVEPNGSYEFTVASSDRVFQGSGGSITVKGMELTHPVAFSRVTYSVAFTETGLPPGTSWSVTLNGATTASAVSSVTFSQTNGSYDYSIHAPSGYSTRPSTGTVAVEGNATGVSVSFQKSSSSTTFLGLSGDNGYILIGVIVAVVAAVAVVALLRSRKPRGAGGNSPGAGPEGSQTTPKDGGSA